ncbi:hypothetical protein EX30DRAFT_99958 [Ascodesmis nigricans]|uniref:CHCH domain-containing protein n=1 Tax=Ascodesmis nigricans TaxID=341454 RepID=A0A4S2N4H9_9PEZI|nr:hypothetical protein EX30DRAFT_99958 [Ascodesmis nigricans]
MIKFDERSIIDFLDRMFNGPSRSWNYFRLLERSSRRRGTHHPNLPSPQHHDSQVPKMIGKGDKKSDVPPNPQTQSQVPEDDDEPDDWDKRIMATGCAEENERLRFCFVDKKDWRLCLAEMQAFRKCWDEHGNRQRTGMKDV